MIAETDLARVELDDALRELGRAAVELDRIDVAPDREKLRRAAVEAVLNTCSAETTVRLLAFATSTVYTVAWRVSGEWSLLCRGRLVKSVCMPALSWSSQIMSLRISGLYAVIV